MTNIKEMLQELIDRALEVGNRIFDAGFNDKDATYFVISWLAYLKVENPMLFRLVIRAAEKLAEFYYLPEAEEHE
jgi:hypothetical protein